MPVKKSRDKFGRSSALYTAINLFKDNNHLLEDKMNTAAAPWGQTCGRGAHEKMQQWLWEDASLCLSPPWSFLLSESPVTIWILLAATEVCLHRTPRCEKHSRHAERLPLSFSALMWEQTREAKECHPRLLSYRFLTGILCESSIYFRWERVPFVYK